MPGIPPILTKGLTGPAAGLLIGQYNLGFITVEVEVIPPVTPPKPQAGAPGVYIPTDEDLKQVVRFTVRYKKKVWKKTYVISRKRTDIIIMIGNIVNTITTNISVVVTKMKKLLTKIRIK